MCILHGLTVFFFCHIVKITTNPDITFFPFVPILPNLYHGLYQLFKAEGKDVGRIRTERGVHTGPDARKPPGCVKNHPLTRSVVEFRPFTSDKRICKVEGLYTPARASTTPGKGCGGSGWTTKEQPRTASPLFSSPLTPFLTLFTIVYLFIYCLFFYFGFFVYNIPSLYKIILCILFFRVMFNKYP